MKQQGTLIVEQDEEFLVVEGGYSRDTRSLNLLARPGSLLFPRDAEESPVEWRDQGKWFAVARHAVGHTQLHDEADEAHRDEAEALVETYLQDHAELDERAWVPLDEQGHWLGRLEKVVPMGLVVSLHDEENDAHEAEGASRVVAITNVPLFLTQLAREGYAGALLEGREPIFFCLDENGELQFLRLRRGGVGKVQMDILRADGGWDDYEGIEEIEFLDNREACDARLVETFGKEPIFDWPEDDAFWSVGPLPDEPGTVVAPEDELPYLLAFTKKDDAESWIEDTERDWMVMRVENLTRFLSEAKGGSAALLNPGAHRVRSGVVWVDGQALILDSFSGFWRKDADDGEWQAAE